jgi:hypothetical protein
MVSVLFQYDQSQSVFMLGVAECRAGSVFMLGVFILNICVLAESLNTVSHL